MGRLFSLATYSLPFPSTLSRVLIEPTRHPRSFSIDATRLFAQLPMKAHYPFFITILLVVTDKVGITLATPTPLFAPFTIGSPGEDTGSYQRLPQGDDVLLNPQLRPVSEIFYAITRSPHDFPPTFSRAGERQGNEYFAQSPNQVVSPVADPPTSEPYLEQEEGPVRTEGPPVEPVPPLPGGPLPQPPQSVTPATSPHQTEPEPAPVGVERQEGVSGPPPMPSLPFHHAVPATLPNTPPYNWIARTRTQAAPKLSSTIALGDGLSATTPSIYAFQPSTTTTAPPLNTGSTSSNESPTVTEASERGRSKKLSSLPIVAIVLGTLGSVALLAFMLIDPRVSRACRSKRVKSKGLGNRPISSWFPFPIPSPQSSSRPVSRKAVGTRRGLELEAGGNSVHTSLATSCPRSKFSISSSDYSQQSRASTSTTDTVLVENTRANESIPPVRPPRPPTVDSPATISDSVYFAPENQIYLEPSFALAGDTSMDQPTGSSTMMLLEVGLTSGSPLLPPIGYFDRPSGSVSSTSTAVASATGVGGGVSQQRQPGLAGIGLNSGLESGSESRVSNNNAALHSSLGLFGSTSDGLSTREESRHSRTHSAPIFTGNPVHDSFQPIYMDPVARKVLQHRRSRSNSGWAYPRKPGANGSFQWSSDEESYHGVIGEAY